MKNLSVKYKSQWDEDATETRDDCGPCSVAMILNYFGENVTTNDVFDRTEAGQGLITIAQLQKAIKSFNYECQYITNSELLELEKNIEKGIPVICLVHYGSFNSRQDKNYNGGHFFVVVGYRDDGYFVNDPDFWGQYRPDGDHHFYTREEMTNGWANCWHDGNPNKSYLVIFPYQEENTVAVESQIFENLVRKSTICDKVKDKLQVEDSETVILAEIDKLIGYEDTVVKKDKQLSSATEEIGKLQTQLEELQKQFQGVKDENAKLVESVNEQKKTIEEYGVQIKSLQNALGEVKEATQKPVLTGWREFLYDLIIKY